jgi:hypothetical protein
MSEKQYLNKIIEDLNNSIFETINNYEKKFTYKIEKKN